MILPAPIRDAIFSMTPCFASRGTPGVVRKFRNSLEVANAAAKSPNCASVASAAPCASATSASAFAYCRLADFNSASPQDFSRTYPQAFPAPPESAAWPAAIALHQRQARPPAPSVPDAPPAPRLRFPLAPRRPPSLRRSALAREFARLLRFLRASQSPAAQRFPA